MDAFLTSIFALALAEMGDRPQILCAALAIRYGRVAPVLWGLGLATLINCVISAFFGQAVNQWISEDPLQLFYALSLVLAGAGMLAWRRPVDLLEASALDEVDDGCIEELRRQEGVVRANDERLGRNI